MTNIRIERDTFGPIEVPADKLWGAQTQRSLQNFDISGEQQPREIIKALARVKRASAVVNHALGLQDENKTQAIVAAADEVIAGKHPGEFPLVVLAEFPDLTEPERQQRANLRPAFLNKIQRNLDSLTCRRFNLTLCHRPPELESFQQHLPNHRVGGKNFARSLAQKFTPWSTQIAFHRCAHQNHPGITRK